MSDFRLPDSTHIGYVHLQVANLDRALDFYRGVLGFQEIGREGKTAILSSSGELPAHLLLTERPGAHPKPPRTTGLYHVAIRLPDRPWLARVLKRLLEHRWPLQGVSDHGVSEAIYLADPDGNGLELYRDRPSDQWTWSKGQIAMSTDPLNVPDLLTEIEGETAAWTQINPATDIGHIHLHVSDLTGAEIFYADMLGLEVMQRSYPGALFLAAGGYHHHLGVNIWAGRGAPPPPPDAVGLIAFALVIPDTHAWDQVIERLRAAGVTVKNGPDANTVLIHDGDRNGVVLVKGGEGKPYP